MRPDGFEVFKRRALAAFPELLEDVREYPELLHLQVAGLRRLMESAVSCGDLDKFCRAAQVVDEMLSNVDDSLDDSLDNALHVSLLEGLEFKGAHARDAWVRMGNRLQVEWRQMNGSDDPFSQ